VEGLYKYLPPFAPDYSGVCSVLFELGGMLVIHDAGGCTGNFTGYDEPRWYGSASAVFSSGLRERETILGDEEQFMRRLQDAAEAMKPSFITILGSPAPMVAGMDYRAVAAAISRRTRLPVLTFDTDGMKKYDVGQSEAFLKLARSFVNPRFPESQDSPQVNIIGATPLDIGSKRAIEGLINQIEKAGFSNISCWGTGSSRDEIAGAAQAKINIVASWSGLAAARYMLASYQTPFYVGIPVGTRPGILFRRDIRRLAGLAEDSPPTAVCRVGKDPRKTLVIGEQVMSNALRTCLQMDFGLEQVQVATFLNLDESLRDEADFILKCEEDLAIIAAQKNYDLVIGDPLYEEALDLKGETRFIKLAHPALSSRLFWDHYVDLFGEGGTSFFAEHLEP
jgi:nitrogenase molybdenum-cofactor synthesis protein NifE